MPRQLRRCSAARRRGPTDIVPAWGGVVWFSLRTSSCSPNSAVSRRAPSRWLIRLSAFCKRKGSVPCQGTQPQNVRQPSRFSWKGELGGCPQVSPNFSGQSQQDKSRPTDGAAPGSTRVSGATHTHHFEYNLNVNTAVLLLDCIRFSFSFLSAHLRMPYEPHPFTTAGVMLRCAASLSLRWQASTRRMESTERPY